MSCNKNYFKSKKLAKAYTKTCRGVFRVLRPYKCFHCDGWHLTSMSKKLAKAKTRLNDIRGHDLGVIMALRVTPTLEQVLSDQRPWMILHLDENRTWVEFAPDSGFSGRIVLR